MKERRNLLARAGIKQPLLGMALLTTFASCKEKPETFVIHSPIYPTGSNNVTLTCRKISGDVENVKLYVMVSNVSSTGVLSSSSPETLVQEWSSPTMPVSYTKSGGYGTNKLVKYRFVVKGNDKTYTHTVSFATRPYPVANQAIPVYCVGDKDKVMNLVFIPDSDIDVMDTFYTAVQLDITDAFQKEDWLRRFRKSHNFYINPVTGHAHDYDTGEPHDKPSNWSNLSFAQGKVILHKTVLRDFAGGGVFSTEYFNRGTILHESGHGLYGMADEYSGGSHWQAEEKPNNFTSLANAQNYAPNVGLQSSDANKIGTDNFWELCNDSCMMDKTGLNVWPYFSPCRNRILYAITQRANGN